MFLQYLTKVQPGQNDVWSALPPAAFTESSRVPTVPLIESAPVVGPDMQYLRLVAEAAAPLERRCVFYLAAAVSDFFVPWAEMASLLAPLLCRSPSACALPSANCYEEILTGVQMVSADMRCGVPAWAIA